MKIPTDYQAGYEKARAVFPDVADNYVAHIFVGDPLGEAVTDDLSKFGARKSGLLIQAAMEGDEEALRDAPGSGNSTGGCSFEPELLA